MNIKRLAVVSIVASLALAQVSSAHAGEGNYVVALGAGVSLSPDYVGSDDYEVGAMPFLSLGWHSDTVIPSDGTGLQLGLHDITLNVPGSLNAGIAKLYRPEGTYRASIGLSYHPGRKESANAALQGMGKIDAHALASVGVNFDAKDSGWLYGINYAGDLGSDDNGSVLTGQIGYAKHLSDELTLTPTLQTSWADSEHMQTYFGVSQQQASNSSNQQFDASSGIKSAGLGLELGWAFSDSWLLNSSLNYTRLTNDAADSPLVKNQGSANQFETSMALIYRF